MSDRVGVQGRVVGKGLGPVDDWGPERGRGDHSALGWDWRSAITCTRLVCVFVDVWQGHLDVLVASALWALDTHAQRQVVVAASLQVLELVVRLGADSVPAVRYQRTQHGRSLLART